jgi:hypothetical protein
MNTQTAKNIRRYVSIKLEEEGLPASEEKKLYKVFKQTYSSADAETKKKYDQNMKDKFEEIDSAKKTPSPSAN